MDKLQKIGGIVALVEAGTFIVGFALYFTVLASANYGSLDIDPLIHVRFLADHQAIIYAWNLIIYSNRRMHSRGCAPLSPQHIKV